MDTHYFVALCLVKQTGTDEDPDVKREIVSAEVLTPPRPSHMAARTDYDRRMPLMVHIERFAESQRRTVE